MHLFTSKALRTQHYLLMPSLMALLSILFISPPATAGRPVIRIMPSTQGSNQISIAAGQTQTVTYLIESALGKPSHWTWSNLSNYLSKVPSVSQPDCAATTFTLAAHGSCYFTIAIDGTGFSSAYQGHPINDGPIFASSALLAYKPSPENQLVISKASHLAAPITIFAGAYNDGHVTRPLISISTDKGLTWNFPNTPNEVIFTPANPNPFVDSGRLGGVSCSGTLCVAAGSYNDGTTKRPLLAFSNDSGQTWTYPAATNAPVFSPVNLHPFVNNGEFWDGALSCSGTTCVAGGQYFDGTIQRPMLAVTNDSGATWTFPASVTELNFSPSATHPFGGTYAEFYAVNCSGTVCTAGGSYNDGVAERPMIGVSQDSGLTWTFPDAVTSPIFTPLNTNPFVENGWFNEAGGTAGLRFWPDSLDFLLN